MQWQLMNVLSDQQCRVSLTALVSAVYDNMALSGSRYMARLRATGADWGLDTRIIF